MTMILIFTSRLPLDFGLDQVSTNVTFVALGQIYKPTIPGDSLHKPNLPSHLQNYSTRNQYLPKKNGA
jgi:hypothetical protein